VLVEDADEGTDAEQPIFGEPGMEPAEAAWDRSRVVALTDIDADHAGIVHAAVIACAIPLPPYALRAVGDQDWVRLTQSQFTPMHIGKNIWVVPSWHDTPDPGALILELDPGLAFGTGSHPTTRLCMEWLEIHITESTGHPITSVLDYGCGSGILAMVAKKLGAAKVVGVDIDPQAIESAEFNSVRNQCDEITYFLPEAFAHNADYQKFDIVAANILSGPLQTMVDMLCARIAPGGSLILSGILATQAQDVINAYAPSIKLSVWRQQEDWVALSGTLDHPDSPQ
ncbi:MAG: 50S ribosomal protein L11 methyltransferase, partial [Glaciimonas sp.]|nr:50S ribosomal protein L11 methyltransferase [Glaciimonas sp.]